MLKEKPHPCLPLGEGGRKETILLVSLYEN